jgi:hypothetical protein
MAFQSKSGILLVGSTATFGCTPLAWGHTVFLPRKRRGVRPLLAIHWQTVALSRCFPSSRETSSVNLFHINNPYWVYQYPIRVQGEIMKPEKVENVFLFLLAVAWWAVVFAFFMDAMK